MIWTSAVLCQSKQNILVTDDMEELEAKKDMQIFLKMLNNFCSQFIWENY